MRLVVFTDLDGTLLDHASYSHEAAEPALGLLRKLGIPLILASSKTAAEIAPLHRALHLEDWPAIVENGAGVFDPASSGESDASEYLRIRRALACLPEDLSEHYRGFGQMTDHEVSDITGLSPGEARLARLRHHSEPGLWTGSDAGLQRFLDALKEQGVSARRGGRFLTLSLGRTKAQAMADVIELLKPETTVALGDAPNDAEMLEAADIGVIVRNDHGTPLPELDGEAAGRIRRTVLPGPEGWNEAIMRIVQELGLN
ncbi:MAG: HAD-IIB family hydrolase [Rhodobiaceae bacterium]|nr:HAD-IIB family hydrolase [Rhodobiaceae bacterium]MCC0049184.1 HAD-IIB family hydrolase [Rhodobiaceae bacterium]